MAMGSAGALLSHPPPQLGGFLRRHLLSLRRCLPFPAAATTPEPLRSHRRHLRCFAVDGSGGRETESPLPPPPPRGRNLHQAGSAPPSRTRLLDLFLSGVCDNSNLPRTIENGSFGGVTQEEQSTLYNFLFPSKELLPDDKMSIFDHLEELRERIFVSVLTVGAAIPGCFAFSRDLIVLLEELVSVQGIQFLQLSPGEFFFTALKVDL